MQGGQVSTENVRRLQPSGSFYGWDQCSDYTDSNIVRFGMKRKQVAWFEAIDMKFTNLRTVSLLVFHLEYGGPEAYML